MKEQYRHFKTQGLYEIICEAVDSETLEELIIYKSVKESKIWARPKNMFFGTIEVDGETIPRFVKVN